MDSNDFTPSAIYLPPCNRGENQRACLIEPPRVLVCPLFTRNFFQLNIGVPLLFHILHTSKRLCAFLGHLIKGQGGFMPGFPLLGLRQQNARENHVCGFLLVNK